MSHLYLSQHPQTAAALTAGRERPLASNFTPPLPHVYPPLDNFFHAFLMDFFFLYLCILGMERFFKLVCFFRSSGPVEIKKVIKQTWCRNGLYIIHPPTWTYFSCMKTYCGTVFFEAQGRIASSLLDHFNNLLAGSKQ